MPDIIIYITAALTFLGIGYIAITAIKIIAYAIRKMIPITIYTSIGYAIFILYADIIFTYIPIPI